MTYRYPPPFMNRLTSEVMSCPPVPVVNLNIPPPGFKPTSVMQKWHSDTHQCQPLPSHSQPSLLLPPQEHTLLQPLEYTQVDASRQEMHAHQISDLLWLKDWLQRRKRTGTHSQQKQPGVPLKVLISCTFAFCFVVGLCHTKISVLSVHTLVLYHAILLWYVNCYLNFWPKWASVTCILNR